MNVCFYNFSFASVAVAEEGGYLRHIFFNRERVPDNMIIGETPLLAQAAVQLQEYFSGRRKTFDLPLAPVGTPFQQQVWTALQKIPYGETASYKDIAHKVGNPKGCRAVGMANNRNPLPIVIPCHRVIGADGRLVGYGGGLSVKIKLLELEQRFV